MPKDRNIVFKGETVLAFDFGLRKIGVAVGNTLTKTTMPLDIIYTKNGKTPWSDIENLLEDWKPLSVIVGDPINMDDTESKMSKEVRSFQKKIEKSLKIECKLHDERLSSFAAKQQMEIIKKYKKQPNPGIDALAAQVILESWLRGKSKNV